MKVARSANAFRATLIVLFVFATGLAVPAQVTDQELLKPDPSDWLAYSGTYNSQRHSLLKQITPQNVGSLRAQWAYQLVGQQHVQAVPVVVKSLVFSTARERASGLVRGAEPATAS